MRVLLLYPKFPPSYWSYEGLLKLIGRKTLLPPLSLITVAAILPQDWEFRLADCNAQDMDEGDWAWADIVMLSGMIVQKFHMLELIREAKQRNKLVAVGGPYVTSVPEDAREAGADFLVLDEGEITIPLFVAALQRGETSGTFQANGKKADMSLSPIPRYDLLDFQDYSEMALQFSRGCPFLCEFCDIIILYGRKPRTKTPEQILAELQRIYDLGWRRSMFLVDDNFIGNKHKVKPLLRAMAVWQEQNDYPFSITTEASVNLADDPELLELMVKANFRVVFIGIETPDVDSLLLTRKNQNTRRPLAKQIQTITRAGLRVMGSFIIGFDGEQPGADQRIIDFVEEAAIPHVMVSMLQALPTTHLMHRLQQEGRLYQQSDHANLHQSCLTNFVPTRPLKQLAQEHINCNWQLYEPDRFLTRTYEHCMNLGRKPVQKKKRPLKIQEFREILALFVLLWRHGFKRHTRLKFWRYLWLIWQEKPSVLRTFLVCCAHFEHFHAYREHIRHDVENQLAQLTDEELEGFVSSPKPKYSVGARSQA